jgi:hypothetical protein
LKIIKADAGEAFLWCQNLKNGDFRMDKDLAISISSIKIKQSGATLDADIKLTDKLKAIELLIKLQNGENFTEGGDLSIFYDYQSAKNTDE